MLLEDTICEILSDIENFIVPELSDSELEDLHEELVELYHRYQK